MMLLIIFFMFITWSSSKVENRSYRLETVFRNLRYTSKSQVFQQEILFGKRSIYLNLFASNWHSGWFELILGQLNDEFLVGVVEFWGWSLWFEAFSHLPILGRFRNGLNFILGQSNNKHFIEFVRIPVLA